ncbi:MAG: hypothetical protein H7Z14_11545 [Anaerolineae bacterium]|nr:hypothetical protein [Phycisphaerae bacterium]
MLDALAQYFQKHNEYPVSLDDLVREGLLTEIPKTPVVSNASERDAWYRAANDRKSCTLVFSYHLTNQLGLGDTTYAEWHSETGQWKMSGPGY